MPPSARIPQSRLTFLQDPIPDRLERAAALNHQGWMMLGARVRGGEVHREEGLLWTETPGPVGEVAIAFPRLTRAMAGERLDAILQHCRRRGGLRSVACWSLLPARPRDLGARLIARGFEWGWQPHWMWLDLDRMRDDFSVPPGLRVESVEEETVWEVDDLPYYDRDDATFRHAAARRHPRRLWHFGAWLDGRPVGHSAVFITTGRLGVAGIYNCGVVPGVRGRGIGKAVTLAACRQARTLGCRHALLNATGMGEPAYRGIGFESIGYGQTWWLHRPTLEAPPPTALQVAFAEAVGRGDIAALDALAGRLDPAALDAPLPGGTTPMDLAVRTAQPRSAEWLAAHGATLDIVSAWDLGWKERVKQMLAGSPGLANARRGGWGLTPLHEAAQRGDLELARVVLAAGPDLEIQDTEFHSTPLGWARHFGRDEIIELIEQRNRSQ